MATCYRHPNRETGVSCSNCGKPDLPGLHDADAGRHALPGVLAAEDAGAHAALDGRRADRDLRADRDQRRDLRRRPGSSRRRARPGAHRSARLRRPSASPRASTGGCITSGFLHTRALAHRPEHARAVLARADDRAGARPRALRRRSTSCRCSPARSACCCSSRTRRRCGASGAVYGLLGAAIVMARNRNINLMQSGLLPILALNLVITFVLAGISLGGHVGGLIGGLRRDVRGRGAGASAGASRRSPAVAFCAVIGASRRSSRARSRRVA